MKLKPLHDRVLVKRLEEEEKTAGGLFIPDSAKEKPIKGEIVAAGPGKFSAEGKKIEMSVKKGDKVLFNKYAGTARAPKSRSTVSSTWSCVRTTSSPSWANSRSPRHHPIYNP